MNEVLKDSGVPWIGLINENYKQIKLKWIVSTKITDGPHTTPELQDEGIPFLSAEAVKNSILDFEYKRGYISISDHEEFCKKCKPKLNDIFMVKSGATTGNIGIVNTDEEFSVWSPLALIRCNAEKANQKFVYYAMLSSCYKTEIELSWSYGTQQNIGMGVIENIHVILPSLNEQKAIANILDNKCEKIDKLILLEETAITELKEYKKSIIQKAVTNGITNTKLKKSNVNWLIEMPVHWEIKRFNYCVKVRQEIDQYSDDKLFLGLENIASWSGKYLETESKYLEKQADIYCKNDVLFSKLHPYLAKVYYANEDGFCTSEFLVIKSFCGNMMYLYFLLLNSAFINIVNSSTYGIKMPRANWDFIKDLKIPVPPIDEQNEIVDFLNKKISKIDNLISLKQQKITELKEYKKSLIYEYVTGKKQPPKKDTK